MKNNFSFTQTFFYNLDIEVITFRYVVMQFYDDIQSMLEAFFYHLFSVCNASVS